VGQHRRDLVGVLRLRDKAAEHHDPSAWQRQRIDGRLVDDGDRHRAGNVGRLRQPTRQVMQDSQTRLYGAALVPGEQRRFDSGADRVCPACRQQRCDRAGQTVEAQQQHADEACQRRAQDNHQPTSRARPKAGHGWSAELADRVQQVGVIGNKPRKLVTVPSASGSPWILI
jgi:hypothetical protein